MFFYVFLIWISIYCPMSDQLVLYPIPAPTTGLPAPLLFAPLAENQWHSALTTLGLIGSPLERPGYCYQAGPEFLTLICFIGCSPSLLFEENLRPTPDQNPQKFIYLEWHQSSQPFFLASSTLRAPHCPHCRQQVAAWQTLMRERQQQQTLTLPWTCPHCQQAFPLYQLHWHKRAVLTTIALSIYGIYESEAIPADRLLQTLQNLTASRWDYCYIRTAPPFLPALTGYTLSS